MPVIDNTDQTLASSLSNALTSSDSIVIAEGFFYFSEFESLVKELKNNKKRIVDRLRVDLKLIPFITQSASKRDTNQIHV